MKLLIGRHFAMNYSSAVRAATHRWKYAVAAQDQASMRTFHRFMPDVVRADFTASPEQGSSLRAPYLPMMRFLMSLISRFPGIAALAAAILLSLQPFPVLAQDYTGPNGMVTLNVPKAPNWAGVPYQVSSLDTHGDRQYDKVMFHVDDFGQYLVVGARFMPPASVAEMDKDEPKVVLRNISEASVMGWRIDFSEVPEIAEESFRDSKHGGAIVRVYRARKGSILVRAQGRRPTRDDAFDTNIVSVAARQGAMVVYVLAQDDSSPDDAQQLVKRAVQLFDSLKAPAAR